MLVSALIDFVMLAMLLRSLITLLFFEEENKFTNFIYYITEPFIVPVRAILYKLNLFQGGPIDFAYMITVVLLGMLSIFI